MDLTDRIERRFGRRTEARFIANWDALNPAYHLPEPVDRDFVLDSVLDAVEPISDGQIPPDITIHGPPGSGKTAVVSAVSSALDEFLSASQQTIFTTTRAPSTTPDFAVVYVDTRRNPSRFKLYQALLDALQTDPVPDRGIGSDDLEASISAELGRRQGLVLFADHVGESETPTRSELAEMTAVFDETCLLSVSRNAPDDGSDAAHRVIEVPPYNFDLIDVLMRRGSTGFSKRFDPNVAKDIAEWADGNAHDALAALFGAAVVGDETDADTLTPDAIRAGKDAIPRGGVSVGEVLALSENKQEVLGTLLSVGLRDERSIEELSALVADRSELSKGTVRRYIYELAQAGVLERVESTDQSSGSGRRPSTVCPQFPTLVYEHLRRHET